MQSIKEKLYVLSLIKIKHFDHEDLVKRIKRLSTWTKIFANDISGKRLCREYTTKSQSSTVKEKKLN